MDLIHGNKGNKIPECTLLHDVLNPSKQSKVLISHYFPIIHRCTNIRMGKAKF